MREPLEVKYFPPATVNAWGGRNLHHQMDSVCHCFCTRLDGLRGNRVSGHWYTHQQKHLKQIEMIFISSKGLFVQVCQDVHLFYPHSVWAGRWPQAATATVDRHRNKVRRNRLKLKLVGSSGALRWLLTNTSTEKSNKAANWNNDDLGRTHFSKYTLVIPNSLFFHCCFGKYKHHAPATGPKYGIRRIIALHITTRQFPAGKSWEWAVRFAPWRKNYES